MVSCPDLLKYGLLTKKNGEPHVNKLTLDELIVQSEADDVTTAMQGFMRNLARKSFIAVMLEEVASLCGKKYYPEEESEYVRAGSAPGRYFNGIEESKVKRPRVKRRGGGEVRLESYELAQNKDELADAMMRALAAGVSSREQRDLFKRTRGTSKSEVSRKWQQEARKYLDEIRSRDLSAHDFLVLMVDGIFLSDDVTAVAAIGITSDGNKVVLDFQIGASESFEVCNDLLTRIRGRGFGPEQTLLAVTDGSKALRKAIRAHWNDAVVQRCLIHKERNIKAYLSYKHHPEVGRLFARLRKAQGLESAEEVVKELTEFLESRNKEACNSLIEAGDELTAVHALDVPATLNRTLLNTNCIENPFRNVRAKTRRVKRWKSDTSMPEKWMAYALVSAEKGFRKINNYADLPMLKSSLRALSQNDE